MPQGQRAQDGLHQEAPSVLERLLDLHGQLVEQFGRMFVFVLVFFVVFFL